VTLSIKEIQTLNCLVGQKNAGLVYLVVFDKSKGTLMAVIVEKYNLPNHFHLVKIDHIVEISKQAVLIDNISSLTEIPVNSLADRALKADAHIIGLPAVVESGQPFGTVTDLNIVWPIGDIWQVVVETESGERLLAKNQIKQITDTEVIFIEDVINPKFKWQADIGAATNPVN